MKDICTIFLLLVFFSACKKEIPVTKPENPEPVDHNTIFPNYVVADSVGEYFIQGTFNGKKICMSPNTGSLDTFFNAYYLNDKIELDQLNLIRSNSEGSAEMQIYLGMSKMQTRPIPYILPHENLVKCEFTQFQFYDKWHRHGIENDQYDDYTYQASTNTGMTLTVTSFTYNVIEGTFSGSLKTNTGKKMTVTNGSFKIKIFIIKQVN